MDIFDVLRFIGGLSLFLYGMNVMGIALERRAGGRLKSILGKMTTNRVKGFLTGCGVTAIIQSSSATTVMVVGFVNSGLMTLKQAINVIMGSNVGTTITGWILSLGGISGDDPIVKMLKPESFVPILAAIGIILYMGFKGRKKSETGLILLGFATLMFGMEMMSDAASVLAEVPAFRQAFTLFENPLLGLLTGALLTAVIQSSSASVGILQALSATGQITYAAAIPIIMGDSIGTCVTALLSSIGAKRDAKRAAMAHLLFNVIGAAVWITVFCVIKYVMAPAGLEMQATILGVAVANTVFKLLCTAVMLPMSNKLEQLVRLIVPDKEDDEKFEIDERLLATPSIAIERCKEVAVSLAEHSERAFDNAISAFGSYSEELAAKVRRDEEITDRMQDMLDSYLVKLSARHLRPSDSEKVTGLMKMTGDFERIGDHAVNIIESCEEMREKNIDYTDDTKYEFKVISSAVSEVVELSIDSFRSEDPASAKKVEPLEEVVDMLKDELRTRHILRMKEGKSSIDAGFIWSDMMTDLERTSDHASNIAGCVLDISEHKLKIHETLRARRDKDEDFDIMYQWYANKYNVDIA
jgi:phosphate:Na+ symporter